MNRIKESIIIAVGLVLMGLCVKMGIDNYADKSRCVTVKGLSEREVEADKVIWPVTTKDIGNELPDLYKRNNATVAKVKAFLLHNGVKESEIMVNSPVVIDLRADQYSSHEAPYRYNITSVITVTSNNVKLVRGIIDKQAELPQQGVAIVDGGYGNRVSYEYTAFQEDKAEDDGGSHKERQDHGPAVCQEQWVEAGQDTQRRTGTVLHRRPRRQHALHKEAARGDHSDLLAEGLMPRLRHNAQLEA